MEAQGSIAHYCITAKLGQGGMGEVYRATDTKLNREVAIKVLPESFAQDPDRLARFTREARALAALNHPNIAAVYGVEERAIVMELVEGPTLADRVANGALPVEEALKVARQIAEALEAAHEKGIIHRDLKPANIKLTPDSVVKVLDFGLATSVESTASAPGGETATMRASQLGVILGTPRYMSPEQASGIPVDRRTDIWAYGAVLCELLTGRPLFDGETISHTLADVLRKEIDLGTLPSATPPRIRELIGRCLDRNLKNRLRDIGEARIAIDAAVQDSSSHELRPGPAIRSQWRWKAASGLLAAGMLAVSAVHFMAKSPELPLRMFSFAPQDMAGFNIAPQRRAAISPDGRQIVYVARNKLWVRPLASEQVRALEGTEGAENPFWAPDSAEIGFAAGGELKKVALAGGSPLVVARLGALFGGGAWSPDGRTILVARARQGLGEVPAGGGEIKTLTEQPYLEPCYLPESGKRFVIARRVAGGLELLDPDSGKSSALHVTGNNPVAFAGGVLYETGRGERDIWILPLSKTGKVEGEPVRVLGVGSEFSVSSDGTLVWVESATLSRRRQLTWRDRNGKKLEARLPVGIIQGGVSISPQGTQATYVLTEQGNQHIWLTDLSREVSTRLTFGEGRNRNPIWSPTSEEIMYASERGGNRVVLLQSARGGAPREVVTARGGDPESWSPDGTTVLFRREDPKTKYDIWAMKRQSDGSFGAAKPWLQTLGDESRSQFSPDGKFVAYGSSETPQLEVLVRPADGGGGPWQVSVNGGGGPRWSRDGREMFYNRGELLLSVPVKMEGGTFSAGQPVEMFRVRGNISGVRPWDVHPDGKRLLVSEIVEGEDYADTIHVIQNWRALLGQTRPQ